MQIQEKVPSFRKTPKANLSQNEMVTVINPLKELMEKQVYSKIFMIIIGEQKFKLESDANSLEKLMKQVKNKFSEYIYADFSLEYFDPDVEEFITLTNFTDLPQNKKLIKLRVIEQLSEKIMSISPSSISQETNNELVLCRENRIERKMRLCLHPVNYAKMRKTTHNKYAPVISFLGPTGGGKSSLIGKFHPEAKPITALQSQPIPTTSNINSFTVNGFEDIPYLRFLDIEGEDGGLPLMEYCKNEGIELSEELSSDDIVEFVRSIFEKCDAQELNAYMEARKKVSKNDFPRLAYIVSDVIVYVNTVPEKRESEYLERVIDFAEKSQKGISSAERPSLILVYNQCPKRETPFNIDESTERFFLLVDREKKLLEAFKTVDFIKLPDWDHADLYNKQFQAFEQRLRRRIKEQRNSKMAQGTLFTDSVWFNILEKVIENFEDEQLSMAKIFSKFIISESSLVNRACAFFDYIYESSSDKTKFLRARHIALQMLAANIVLQSKEQGHEVMTDSSSWKKLFQDLLSRIEKRTPCEKMFKEFRCTQELQTHEAHRFTVSLQGNLVEEIVGKHFFEDPETEKDLQNILISSVHQIKTVSQNDFRQFHRKRLTIFQEGIKLMEKKSYPKEKCFICLKNRQDSLLSCRHAFCQTCIIGILSMRSPFATHLKSIYRSSSMDNANLNKIVCPICSEEVIVIENIPFLPGKGLRVLSLDGGGFRAMIQLNILKKIQEFSEMDIGSLFDVIGGTGVSGILTLCLGKSVPLEICSEFFLHLGSRLRKKSILEKILGARVYRFIFGTIYDIEEFEMALKEIFGENSDFMSAVIGNNLPKYFVLASETRTSIEPVVIGNYPAGKRNKPIVKPFFKFWEAARACSCTPPIFEPFELEHEAFIDGSLHAVNPSEFAMYEAHTISGYSQQVDFMLSLGTGLQSSKNPKSDANFRFLNETIDLAKASSETSKIVTELFPLRENYIRLNPLIGVDQKEKSTIKEKNLKDTINSLNLWLNECEAQIKDTAYRLRAKSFFLEPTLIQHAKVGDQISIPIITRKPMTEIQSKANFNVEIRDNTSVINAQIVKMKQLWMFQFTPTNPGLFHCSISVYFGPEDKKKNYPISGSPFYLKVVEPGITKPTDIPFYISFLDFMRSFPLSAKDVVTDEKKIQEEKKILTSRLELLGIKTNISVSNADTSGQMRAVSEQLFGSTTKFVYVRKIITGWLRNHADFKLPDDITIEERIGGGSFDEYCDNMEQLSAWGDVLSLVAISEFFGVRIIVVSGIEGEDFITDYQPYILHYPNPILFAHWGNYCYSSIKPYSTTQLFKLVNPKIVNFDPSKLRSISLSVNPRSPRFNQDSPSNILSPISTSQEGIRKSSLSNKVKQRLSMDSRVISEELSVDKVIKERGGRTSLCLSFSLPPPPESSVSLASLLKKLERRKIRKPKKNPSNNLLDIQNDESSNKSESTNEFQSEDPNEEPLNQTLEIPQPILSKANSDSVALLCETETKEKESGKESERESEKDFEETKKKKKSKNTSRVHSQELITTSSIQFDRTSISSKPDGDNNPPSLPPIPQINLPSSSSSFVEIERRESF